MELKKVSPELILLIYCIPHYKEMAHSERESRGISHKVYK